MPLFSRLRALARSRPAPESSNFPSTTQHDTHDTIQPWSIPQDEASVSTPQGPRFGVKIHPDINALLAEVESGEAVEDEPSSQLWMSSGDLSTEDRFSSFPMRETRPGASSDVEDQRGYFGEDNESPEDPVELEWVARRDDKGKGRAVDDVSDGISQAPSGSQRRWPTFGKERRRVIPDLRIFGRNPTTRRGIGDRTEEDSAGVARQSSSSTRLDNVYGQEASSSPSRRTTRSSWTYRRKSTTLSRRSSDGRSSLQPNASTSAVNTAIPTPPLSRAPSHSQRNLENRPDAFLEMPKAPRNDENAPLDAQQEVLYSPQAPTFGFPSPTSRPLSVIPSPDTSEFVTPASPPPLHSTPNNARTTEADVGLFDFNPPSSGPDRNFRFRGSNRQRQLTFGGASSTLNSLGPPSSSTFGKNPRSRALSDRPKASKIFSDTHSGGTMHVETELAETSRSQPFGNSTNLKLRSGSDPPKHRSRRRSAKRRRSAEWRSHTAAAGVTASPKEASNYGWPADVSRAILQLSLGEPAMATTTTLTREVQHTKTSSISCASRGQSAVLLPTSDKEAMYARPNREGVSQYNTFPASRRQSQMRTEVPPHALSFSFPILPSPSSSPSTASPAFNAGPASAPAEPTVSQPGPRQTSRSQGIGSKISETRGLGTGRTDEIGNGTGATREGKSKERDSGMIHHVRSTSESHIRWSSKKMQDLLDRAELESGEGGVRQDTSIALPPKETLRLVPSTSSKDQLVSARPTSLGSLDRLHSNSVDEPIATSTPPPKSDKSKGKRKAEETEDGSPPKSEGRKSSFAATSMRGPRVSNASHAPSSFLSQKSRKRVRLSSPLPSPSHSRRGSISNNNAQGVGTWSSRNSSRTNASSSMQQASTSSPPPRTASRASHARSASVTTPVGRQQTRRSISVMSQSSIPISAIISPHPPSIDRLSTFHVRDPKKPPPKRSIGWTLRLRTADDHGSPIQAWCFWAGFIFPLLWWFASLWPIPKTRILDAEKSIPVDDPNVEHENRIWRKRCRIASVVFFFTYVPVIVLLAVFA